MLTWVFPSYASRNLRCYLPIAVAESVPVMAYALAILSKAVIGKPTTCSARYDLKPILTITTIPNARPTIRQCVFAHRADEQVHDAEHDRRHKQRGADVSTDAFLLIGMSSN